MNTRAPHEIRRSDGSAIFRCRPCGATENLHWYGGTSCPVCSKAECLAALDKEYAAALYSCPLCGASSGDEHHPLCS